MPAHLCVQSDNTTSQSKLSSMRILGRRPISKAHT
jgi:hypothetical protein